MKKVNLITTMLLAGTFAFVGCEQSDDSISMESEVPANITSQLVNLGFDVTDKAPLVTDGGFIVEGDIFLSANDIATMSEATRLPNEEQYSTNNLVSTSGSRTITIYAPSGRKGYSAGMLAGLDLAITRYNAENLEISFQRVTSSGGADISMTRLSKRDERRGVLGSAGFPTSSGDPYNNIKMSGILESSYGLSTSGIATIIGHEMGHCIGFRHTDYFNRSISCGGSADNEGSAGIGANLIPGTPSGASASANSWMLACTDGGDRPFNNDDQTALDFLY
jgi:hypothetical protein